MWRSLTDLFPGAVTRELLVSAGPGWNAFNPSIAWSPVEGYKLVVRSSNYRLDQYGQYNVSDPDGVIRTRNYLGTLDCDLNLVDLQLLKPPDWGPVLFPPVRGLEDARLYWQRDHWQVYGTLREHRSDGLCQIAEARLDHDQMIDARILENPEPGRHQKNWMKFGSGSNYVYTCNPQATLEKSLGDAVTSPVSREFRGGSPLIPLGESGCYIAIIHEVNWQTGHRRYFHRFVMFSHEGFMLDFTPPFFFNFPELLTDLPMIEYGAGLVVHQDDYIVSYGYQDSRAFLARVPRFQVHAAMESAFT